MKRLLGLSVFVALALTGHAAFAADDCTKITVDGPSAISGDRFQGRRQHRRRGADAGRGHRQGPQDPASKSKFMGTWADAQAAARDGKADMIFGIYYNDERATYLDYVQPAFMYDDVAVFVAKGKDFPFNGQDDLIGKKGVTNQGESYGTEFDAFIKDKLDVARADGIDDAFKDLLGRQGRLFDRRLLSRSRRSGQRGDQGQSRGAETRRCSPPKCSSPSRRSRPAALWLRSSGKA